MGSAWRGLIRGRFLLLWVTVVVLAGSGVTLYVVYEGNKPLTSISARPDEPRQSTISADAAAPLPPFTLAEVLEARRADLERDRNAPVLGNPDGDVTVVEFFDYNCPFCKRIAPHLQQLIQDDPGVRLVYREWPILSNGSLFAARAALAARRQGKYEEMHWVLMSLPRVTQDSTLQAARRIGIDVPRLLNDMNQRSVERHLALSFDLARSLGINGTPSFIIGDAIARGAVSPDELNGHVRNARAAKANRQ